MKQTIEQTLRHARLDHDVTRASEPAVAWLLCVTASIEFVTRGWFDMAVEESQAAEWWVKYSARTGR